MTDFTLIPTWVEPECPEYHNAITQTDAMKKDYLNLSTSPILRYKLRWEGMSDTDYSAFLVHYDACLGGLDSFDWTSVPAYISGSTLTGRWVDGSLMAKPIANAWQVEIAFEVSV